MPQQAIGLNGLHMLPRLKSTDALNACRLTSGREIAAFSAPSAGFP